MAKNKKQQAKKTPAKVKGKAKSKAKLAVKKAAKKSAAEESCEEQETAGEEGHLRERGLKQSEGAVKKAAKKSAAKKVAKSARKKPSAVALEGGSEEDGGEDGFSRFIQASGGPQPSTRNP